MGGYEYDEDEEVDEKSLLEDDELFQDEPEVGFNLVSHTDTECLFEECSHFCPEPTEKDLDALRANGFGADVRRWLKENPDFELD